MSSLRDTAQQALEALEILRSGLIQMREHAESYGEAWARAYVKEYRDLLPGSAEEQFRALNAMQHRLADVADGVVKGFDAITALRAALAEQPAEQEPVTAQHRFRHPQKGTPDWSVWQPCKVAQRPAWEVDSQGYEVEYRALYTAPQPPTGEKLNDQ